MTKPRQPMTLQAHPNVASLEDERRAREQLDLTEWVLFIDPPPPPGSRAAQAQAEGLAQFIRQQEAQEAARAAIERRPRPNWLKAILASAPARPRPLWGVSSALLCSAMDT